MAMPEASGYKDSCVVLGKYDIRFLGKVLSVQAIPITQ
jgi:hypothetical protein